MRKILILLLMLLVVPLYAFAELSTNLNVVTVMNKQLRTLPDSKTYVDADGNVVVPDDKGYATVKYTYHGRVLVKEEYLDKNGKPVNCVDGYSCKVNKYNRYTLLGVEYYDAQGKPANGPQGYARQEIKYEKRKHKSTWNYDAEGNPVGSHRISEYKYYGMKIQLVSDTWYDTDGNLTPGPKGYARVEYEYDGDMTTRLSYIAADGSLYYLSSAGYAQVTATYKNKKVISMHYYGKDNELVAGPDGYAYMLCTHQNNTDTEMYYNADGTPYFNEQGLCGIGTTTYADYRKEEFYFIGEGLRGPCDLGYYKIRIYSNARRQETARVYLDQNDQMMIVDSLGYAKVAYSYQSGEVSKTEFFGANGERIRSIDGYAVLINTVTRNGIEKTEFFDVDGRTRVTGPEGYARVDYKYDKNKNTTDEKYYMPDGKPCYMDGLYNEVRYTWSGKNKTGESYWRDWEKTSGSEGYHEVKYEYNSSEKESRASYYGTDNQLMLCSEGYAIVETEYNSNGGLMCKKYYGTDRQLILTPGKEYAFVKTILFKDLKATSVPENEYEDEPEDISGDVLLQKKNEKETEDNDGTVVEYHGLDGRLMKISSGYAYVVRRKNEQGKIASEEYYDTDGKPALLPQNYTCVMKEYDEAGNLTVEQYYGADGEKTVCRDGYDEIRREYNDQKQAIRLEYRLNGDLVVTRRGYAILKQEYNEEGLVCKESYFGVSEEPVISTAGYHTVDKVMAGQNRAVSEAWFDTEGNPVYRNGAYCRIEREFDESGKVITERYYGADGEKVPCREGYDELHRNPDGTETYYLNGEEYFSPEEEQQNESAGDDEAA